MSRLITVREHEVVPVGSGAGEFSPGEVDRLVAIGRERPGFCTLGHRSVRLAHFAGLVNLGGRLLEVLPKVTKNADRAFDRGVFLRLLHAARSVPIHSLGTATHDTDRRSLLNVFVSAYLAELIRLARGGLLRRYRTRSDDLRVVRGRLQVSRHAAVHAFRPDLLPCRFDELTVDNPHNRVLRAALFAVRPWMEDIDDARAWLELNAVFEGVATVRDAGILSATLKRDRQTVRYEAALEWASLILRLLSPNVRAGSHAAPEMLFDMNRLFEAAVATRLRSVARAAGAELAVQDTSESLGHDGTRDVFGLRPDFVLRRAGRVIAVADAKWVVADLVAGRIRPAEAHVYQMSAYASAYDCSDFFLLYPWHSGLGADTHAPFVLRSRGRQQVRLHALGIDVGHDGFPLRNGTLAV